MLSVKKPLTILALTAFLFFPSCKSQSENKVPTMQKNIKKSQLAGSWYPASKDELTKMLDGFLKEANPPSFEGKEIAGIISPHAGYLYSGLGAAFSYKTLQGKNIDRVFILAPSHHAAFRGFSTPDYTYYETPLGEVEIDTETVKSLKGDKLHVINPAAHEPEHSIEIQLPFLQMVLKNFKVVPILMGEMREDNYIYLANLLKNYRKAGTVFVVSSDFTHYGERFDYLPFKFKMAPTKEVIKDALKRLDGGAIDEILKLNSKSFLDYASKTGITICGKNPIALLLKILEGDKEIKPALLKHYTSIDTTGDFASSVSYASMVFYKDSAVKEKIKPTTEDKKIMPKGEEYNLTAEEKKTLLTIARDTINSYLSKNKYPDKGKYSLTSNLEAKRGVFVTLTKGGNLRGCIGYIEGIKPVYEAVMENAVNAALEDPRFSNVTLDEIPKLDIEISVMTPLTPVEKLEEIEVGKHGLVIAKGWAKGLLLPQVATEWNWNREQFLEGVSNKAGLPRDAYKDKDTKLWKFSAIVFGEKEKKH